MKSERHRAIIDLVRTKDIFTQGELSDALIEAGFTTTQATVSRDIRELRLTKEPTNIGQKYVAPIKDEIPKHRLSPVFRDHIFRDALVSADYAGNMLVLRTLIGMAMAVATALDDMNFPEILGTIAGDDVVMCVIKSESHAAALVEKLMP